MLRKKQKQKPKKPNSHRTSLLKENLRCSPVSHCQRPSEETSGLRSRRPWSLGCVPRLSLELLVVLRMRKKEIAVETKVQSRKTLKC